MASLYRRYQRGLFKPRRIGFVPFEHKPPAGAVAIGLTKGCTAWVDEADWPLVSQYRWSTVRRGPCVYAESATGAGWCDSRRRPEGARERRIIAMHRLLVESAPTQKVDHRDRSIPDVVDNRRSNLRVASHFGNMANQRKTTKPKTSAFKGVCWHAGRWRAGINVRGATINLGRHREEMAAARAYDFAAVEHFGEFACTNFQTPGGGHLAV